MNKNNKIFIALSVVITFVLLIVFYFLLNMKDEQFVKKQNFVVPEDGDVIVGLKKENQEAIEKAESASSLEFRKIDESDHVMGEENAVVEIVFYGDYDDDFSSQLNKTLKKAVEEFDKKIKIAFRHFPQRQHADSFEMALASECADAQGKFWEMHEALFTLKDEKSFSQENLMKKVSSLGLDSEKFDKCLSDENHRDKILNQIDEAGKFTVIGTPTTYINDTVLIGATPWEDFVDSAGFEREGVRSVVEKEIEK